LTTTKSLAGRVRSGEVIQYPPVGIPYLVLQARGPILLLRISEISRLGVRSTTVAATTKLNEGGNFLLLSFCL
jgi:hypothetical protein